MTFFLSHNFLQETIAAFVLSLEYHLRNRLKKEREIKSESAAGRLVGWTPAASEVKVAVGGCI